MLVGYARVSKLDQDSAAQVAALKAAGCEKIFREKASGGRWDHPELHRLMEHLYARATCWSSGNWTGFLDPFATF